MNRRGFFGSLLALATAPLLPAIKAFSSPPLAHPWMRFPKSRVDMTLTKDEWIKLDEAIMYAARKHLRHWKDVEANHQEKQHGR